MAAKRTTSQRRRRIGFTIGRAAFERIGAIEGIVPTQASHLRAVDFERRALSAAERRREIVAAHKPKG